MFKSIQSQATVLDAFPRSRDLANDDLGVKTDLELQAIVGPRAKRGKETNKENIAQSPAAKASEEAVEQLKKGILPDLFCEEFKVVPPGSEQGRRFQEEQSKLLSRLAPEWDPQKHPVQFLLCDLPHFNAFQIRQSPHAILGFNKECFADKGNRSLDLAACILGHEGTHRLAEVFYGKENADKIEEATADILPLERVHDAGLDPTASRRFFVEENYKAHRSGGRWNLLFRSVDVHPNHTTRISLFDAALTRLYVRRGDLEREETKFDENHPLHAAAFSIEYESPFHKHMRSVQEQYSDKADGELLLSSVVNYLQDAPYLPSTTAEEISKYILRISANYEIPEQLLGQLADRVLDKIEAGWIDGAKEIYGALSWISKSDTKKEALRLVKNYDLRFLPRYRLQDLVPLGRLRRFETAASNFVNAKNSEQALRAAIELQEAYSQEKSLKNLDRGQRSNTSTGSMLQDDPVNLFYRKIKWTRFEVDINAKDKTFSTYNGKVPCPWNKHLDWAQELGGSAVSAFADAKAILGITEPRALVNVSENIRHDYLKGCLPLLGIGPVVNEYIGDKQVGSNEFNYIAVDENGEIVYIAESQSNALIGTGSGKHQKVLECRLLKDEIERLLLRYDDEPELQEVIRQMQFRRSFLETPGMNLGGDIDGTPLGSLFTMLFADSLVLPEIVGATLLPSHVDFFLELNKACFRFEEGQKSLVQLMIKQATYASNPVQYLSTVCRGLVKSKTGLTVFPLQEAASSEAEFLASDPHEYTEPTPNSTGKSLDENGFESCELIEFLLDQPSSVLSDKDKLKFLSQSIRWSEVRSELNRESFQEKHMGLRFANSTLPKLLSLVAGATGDPSWKNIDSWDSLSAALENVRNIDKKLLSDIVYLQASKLSRGYFSGKLTMESIHGILAVLPKEFTERKRDHVFRRFKKAAQGVSLTSRLTYDSLDNCIMHWCTLHDRELVAPSKAYSDLILILENISNINDPNLACDYYEKLLSRRNTRILDPDVRNKLVDHWLAKVVEIEGCEIDIQSASERKDYHSRIMARIKKLRPMLPAIDRPYVLNKLSEEILAQYDLSQAIGKEAGEVSAKELEKLARNSLVGDVSLDQLRYQTRYRRELIDFLTKPVTKSSAEIMVKSSYKVLNRRTHDTFGSVETVNDDPTYLARPRDRLSRRLERERLMYFHKEFENSPVEAQVGLIRELLLPALPDPGRYDEAIAFDYALDRVFPKDDAITNYTKRRIKTYIRRSPDFARPLALSAQLAASRRGKRGASPEIGKAIAGMIEAMGGPAEYKTGQAAQGHPKTRADIREALRHLKTMTAPPLRAVLCKMIEKDLAPEITDRICGVGKILGAGSLYIAVEVLWLDDDGTVKPKVLSILRPFAKERGATGFRSFYRAFEEDTEEDPISTVVKEQMKEGERFLAIESDSIRALDLGQYTQAAYGGYATRVSDRQFEFSPPRIIAASHNCFVSDKAEGEHVIDLEKDSSVESEHVTGVYQSIIMLEFKKRLSLDRSECDRHGGNAKVSGFTISPFDTWGLLYDPPTHKELEAFARSLARAFANTRRFSQFQERFTEELNKSAGEFDNPPAFFSTSQRALLALAEYSDRMPAKKFLAAMGAGISKTPDFVQDIFQEELSKTWAGRWVFKQMTNSIERQELELFLPEEAVA